MKTTRQGLRDLDAIGPKPERGHVGRSVEIDRAKCQHVWEDIHCDGRCYIYGCDHPSEVCRTCGRTR